MPQLIDGPHEEGVAHGAVADTRMTMFKIGRVAVLCVTAIALCAMIFALRGRALGAGGGLSDQQLIAYLQKHYRLPSTRNITLGPPIKTPFSKLLSRTVTVSDEHGNSFKAGSVFVQPGVNDVIVGEVLDLGSDPWGRISLNSMHLADRPTLGPANAPITIVEFADFECPHCAHAMGIVETVVESKYTGKVRLVFKNFPLQGHQWAHAAAVAAQCVYLQNPATFWDFAREIYRDQAFITPDNLGQHIEDFAHRNQLDPEALHACEMGQAADQRVAQDIQDGEKARVTSTPTLFINGIPVLGAEPEVLDSVINSELKKQAG
jgi:protein-disulfide isomerase